MSDIQGALTIPREALITRLTEVRQEHVDKRAEAESKAAAERQRVTDAVSQLTADQVANILHHYISVGNDELIKWVEDKVEKGKFKTISIEPTGAETALDRTIRVLKLASDKEIQVKPSDSIYAYL